MSGGHRVDEGVLESIAGKLTHAAGGLDELAAGVDTAADRALKARNDAESGWDGPTSENFSDKIRTGANKADAFADEARDMAIKIDDVGGALQRVQREMEAVRDAAAKAGLGVEGYVIHPPGELPAGADQQAADEHAAKVRTYNQAHDDAEDNHRYWHSYVDAITSSEVGKKPWFTVADIAGGQVLAAAGLHRSILLEEAQSLRDQATRNFQHLQRSTPDIVYNRQSFYSQQDYLREQQRTNLSQAKDAQERADRTGRTIRLGTRLGGAGLVGLGIGYDMSQGKPATQAVASNAAGGAASAAGVAGGAKAGAKAGAIVGSVVPGKGTAIGAGIGTVVGAGAGIVTSGMVDSMFEKGVDTAGDVGRAIVDGGRELVDSSTAIADQTLSGAQTAGEVITDGARAVSGGVKDAWDSIF